MIETVTTETGETIRTMTPVEYQKVHAAEESRTRHRVDLKDFVAFLLARVDVSESIPNETLDALIADYLDTVEPEPKTS